MGRLVDANLLKEKAVKFSFSTNKWVSDVDIDLMPTVDAVPVVRCSECKNLEMINNEGVFAKCNKHNMLFLLWEDDIRENGCSWGEEREDV